MVTDQQLSVAEAARDAHIAGLSVVPAYENVNPAERSKRPAGGWERYQTTRPTVDQLRKWYSGETPRTGIGIVCGAVSGGLEMFEFEGRAVDEGMFTAFLDAMEGAGFGDVMHRIIAGYSEITPSGGYHLLYRCTEIAGNTVLAAYVEDVEGKPKRKPLIETRGEGGYTIVAPTHGNVHPNGGAWIRDTGSFATIPDVTPIERQAIFDVAKLFDRAGLWESKATPPPPAGGIHIDPSPHTGESWFAAVVDDYNRRTTWDDVLAGHFVRRADKGRTTFWHYEGASNDTSATTNFHGTDRLHIFSSTAQLNGWPADRGTWDRFSAALFIATGRDDRASRTEFARELRARGYGPPPSTSTPPPQPAVDPDELEAFWTARPELERIRAYALAKRAAPWACLGVVLVRIVACLPPNIVLPDLIGSYGSLNLFVGIVAPSGGGKGAALATGADAVEIGLMAQVDTHTPGSGHGIAHAYAHREKGELVRDADRVLFTVEEVDHLASLGAQNGSTLLAELRRVYMAEKLGHLFVDPTKRVPIDAHSYRAGLIVGIQPTRAGVLLDDADGGTPQRFVWLPTTYPHPDERPPVPAPWKWTAPTLSSGRNIIKVCDTAAHEIDASALARSRGEGDPLDGHRLLCREKVAAALGLLNGRLEINDDDWRLSGVVMAVSDATRSSVVGALCAAASQRNIAKAKAEGDRAVVVTESTEKAGLARTGQSITRALSRRDGWVAGGELRRGLTSDARKFYDAAIDHLLAGGQIERRDTLGGGGNAGIEYRIPDPKTRV